MVADLPGLISGASEGAGLGHLFLRHLSRTRLLLHIVDVSTLDPEIDPVTAAVEEIHTITEELRLYSPELNKKPRWLVLNKMDMIDEPDALRQAIIERLDWDGPVFSISALTGAGTKEITLKIQSWLDAQRREELEQQERAAGTYVESDPRFDENRQNIDDN